MTRLLCAIVALSLAFVGSPAIGAAQYAVPTPSPSLSPLPAPQINFYAVKGAYASGLDPQFVRAVIDAESAGDPHAVSRAGAVGLMQLEPETARDCGIHDRFDALANVICGARSLAGHVHKYGMKSGIAAFNFGSGNVEAVGGDLRRMPVETQNYVAVVIARYDELQHDGALVVETPQPSPSASPSPSPCAHRVICGPIRILPHDAAGWQRAAAQIIASFVSDRAFRASRATASVTYPVLGFVANPGAAPQPAITGSHIQNGALLGSTSAHPFLTALATYMFTDTVEHGMQSVFRMPVRQQQTFERFEAIAAVGDAIAYQHDFAAAHALHDQSAACQREIDDSQTTNSRIAWSGNAQHGAPILWNPQSTGLLMGSGGACEQFGAGPATSGRFRISNAAAVTLRPSRSYSRLLLASEVAYGFASAGTHAFNNIGPVHLLPSDPAERKALLINAASALVDGFITAHGTHGDPRFEGDPLVRPFVRGGMPSMIAGWTLPVILRSALVHSASTRTELDLWEARSHIFGVGSWLSPQAYPMDPAQRLQYADPLGITQARSIKFRFPQPTPKP
ncbi:MAG TPA: lytic transglycosylase domain-containing protein [Candidatus Rubrimentiphilum sp.]|nr:lytic transglycosylase domain-containing protein [Candidatus Rubrimentiphilum sp.]